MDIQTLATQFCEFSFCFKGYTNATIRRYKYSIRFYCSFAHIAAIDQVSNDNIRAFFHHGRTERRWSVSTFLTYHKSLVTFFDWCMSNGFIESNPVRNIELPKLEKKLPGKLNKQDSMRLLEIVYNYPYANKFLQYRNHAIIATFIYAGLRKKELLNLKYRDVDIDNLTLFINQGKGGKDRMIPICEALARSLTRYFVERRKLNKTCPEFFASSRRNNGISEKTLARLVEQLRKITQARFSIHKLRHTFATLMLEGGCDIYSLSKMMGHSNIQTTTIYLSATVEHLRQQIMKHPLS